MKRTSLLLLFLFSISILSAQTNVLTNGDFETGDFTGWSFGAGNTFNEMHGNFNTPSVDATHMNRSMKMFGPFAGGFGQSFRFQDGIAAAPGQVFDACIEMNTLPVDLLQGSNISFIRIAFFDNTSTEISGMNSASFTTANTANTWESICINGAVAPAGTATVGYFVFFHQFSNADGGSIFYDNAQLLTTDLNQVAVPTMSQWGLIALGILLMIMGVIAFRQRATV